MLEKLSEETQLVLIIVLLGILYLAVIKNNRKNKEKRYDRKSRNFRKNVYEKIKEKENEEKS